MYISKGTIIGAIIGFIFIQIGIGLYHGATIRWDRVGILAKYAILFCLIWLLYKLIKARRKQEQEKYLEVDLERVEKLLSVAQAEQLEG